MHWLPMRLDYGTTPTGKSICKEIYKIKCSENHSIYPSDIKLVLLHGSLYKQEIDAFGDLRYTMRGWDRESKGIRITFIIKQTLIIVTVIREEEMR